MYEYKKSVSAAVRLFRPVMTALSLRDKTKQSPVYLASFDTLDMLEVDNFVVEVIQAQMDNTQGLFFCRVDGDFVRCTIVIKNSLYDSDVSLAKIVGVHEFCHFLALVYAVTATSIDKQKTLLLARLSKGYDLLNKTNFDNLVTALTAEQSVNIDIADVFDDRHFRLDIEDNNIDYAALFRHLMFSRELFEETFTKEKQDEFRALMSISGTKGLSFYMSNVYAVADNKSVPHKLALSQSLLWAKAYL